MCSAALASAGHAARSLTKGTTIAASERSARAPSDRTGRLFPPPKDTRPEIDLLKVVGWPMGGYFIVLGLVALARAGFDRFDLFEPTVQVGPFTATRLLALILLALGIVIWAGVVGSPDDLGLRVLGATMVVIGIVWVIEPGSFEQWLAIGRNGGIQQVVAGALLIITSLIQPFRVGRPPASPPPSETS